MYVLFSFNTWRRYLLVKHFLSGDRMQPVQEMYCQVPVRVHVRRPGKDTWIYVGRATVSHEVMGHSSRVGSFLILNVMLTTLTVLQWYGQRVTSRSLPLERLDHLSSWNSLYEYLLLSLQHSELQAERRGNFVIVACVEPTGDVLSWSLCVRKTTCFFIPNYLTQIRQHRPLTCQIHCDYWLALN